MFSPISIKIEKRLSCCIFDSQVFWVKVTHILVYTTTPSVHYNRKLKKKMMSKIVKTKLKIFVKYLTLCEKNMTCSWRKAFTSDGLERNTFLQQIDSPTILRHLSLAARMLLCVFTIIFNMKSCLSVYTDRDLIHKHT